MGESRRLSFTGKLVGVRKLVDVKGIAAEYTAIEYMPPAQADSDPGDEDISGLPSTADLDAVAAEDEIKERS